MRKRPLLFLFLTLAFVAIAFSFPLQSAFVYGDGLFDIISTLKMISLLNVLVMVALVANVPLLLRASPFLVISVPFAMGVVLWNNYVVGSMNMGVTPQVALLASIGFVSLSATLLSPSIRNLLRNPAQRWWLQSRRAQLKMPAEIKGCRLDVDHLNTYDISSSGAFLTGFSDFEWENPPEMGKVVDLSLTLTPLLKVKCEAKLVRLSEGDGPNYPRGVGIQFVGMDRKDQVRINRYIRDEIDHHPRNEPHVVDAM